MKKIEDDRVRFYLKHQELIETWADLSQQVTDVANDFLSICSQQIEKSVSQLGSGAKVYFRSKSDYPAICLHKSHWRGELAEPTVAIALEWPKKKVGFRGPHRPYSGLRVGRKQRGGAALVEFLRDELDDEIKANGFIKGAKTSSWVAYRYEGPTYDEFWDDLEPLATDIVESLKAAWDLFTPAIDKGLGLLSSSSTEDQD